MSSYSNSYLVRRRPQLGFGGTNNTGPTCDCSWCGEPIPVNLPAFVPMFLRTEPAGCLPEFVPQSEMHVECAHAMIDMFAQNVEAGGDGVAWVTGAFARGTSQLK